MKVGDKIRIIHLAGEDNRYDGREGVITHIDSIGQLHGTWGGLAVIPTEDEFEIITTNSSVQLTLLTVILTILTIQSDSISLSCLNLGSSSYIESADSSLAKLSALINEIT